MKKILLFVFLSVQVFAQQRQIDSLKALLQTNIADSTRIRIFYQLSDMNILPSEQMDLVNQGFHLSQKINSDEGYLEGIFKLSFKNNVMGNWAKGLEIAYQGIDEAKKRNNKSAELNFMTMVAMSYQKQKDYKNMLGWSKRIINLLDYGGYPDIGTSDWAASMMVSGAYTKMGQSDSAVIYAKRSYQSAVRNKVPFNLHGYSYQSLGNALAKQKKYDEAFANFQKSMEHLKEDEFSVNEVEIDVANMFMSKNDKVNAEKYALLAYNGTLKLENPNVKLEACRILSELYEPQSKEKAYPFLKTYQTVKDSIFTREKFNEISQIESAEKRKMVQARRALEEAKTQAKENVFLVILGFLALLASVLGYFFFQKQKTNRQLQEQKNEVESTLKELKSTQTQLIQKEKLASLGELTAGIAHEIQNPLNFVNNFSELSRDLVKDLKEEIENPDIDKKYVDEILSDLSQNQDKIHHHGKRASSIVKGMLEHSRTSTGEKQLTDINLIADEYLRLSYHGMRAKDKNDSQNRFNADFKTKFDENLPKINLVSQDIGRVLLNLFNNAFYAVQKVENPLVFVSTEKIGNDILIKVKDNGSGISKANVEKIFQPFFTTKPTGEGTGLGLSLSYDIITKGHNGTLEVESIEGEGTTFIIKIPISAF